MHKFASQCQLNANKVAMVEQVLTDYKLTVLQLSSNKQIEKALSDQGSDTVGTLQSNL